MLREKVKTYILLQIILVLYSCSGIFSKLAAGQRFLSARFCLCYSAILALLFLYAIGWQQVIKRLPLTAAFANKAVTVVWGIVWGALFFHEAVTAGKVIGAALIMAGIVIYSGEEGERRHE